MNNIETGFDTNRYMREQFLHIESRLAQAQGNQTYLEFGGKPFGDYHAERVLPGYDPDCKASLLSHLLPLGKIVMVVNARDILLPLYGRTPTGRIRGDSLLRYDDETVRLIRRARELDFEIDTAVVAIAPRNPIDQDRRALDMFRETLFREGVDMKMHYEIDGYPDVSILDRADEIFARNDVVSDPQRHLIAFSPGGGSGKFGVLLSEMYHALVNGRRPNVLKFETFPVLSLPHDHALNLAFEIATADLQNRVVALKSDRTSYDKDVENFALMQQLYALYDTAGWLSNVDFMKDPTEMSVNMITEGIIDEEIIIEACRREVERRIARYTNEVLSGTENDSTLKRALEVREHFLHVYGRQSGTLYEAPPASTTEECNRQFL